MIIPEQRYSIGEKIRRLASFVQAMGSETMRNRTEFLWQIPYDFLIGEHQRDLRGIGQLPCLRFPVVPTRSRRKSLGHFTATAGLGGHGSYQSMLGVENLQVARDQILAERTIRKASLEGFLVEARKTVLHRQVDGG